METIFCELPKIPLEEAAVKLIMAHDEVHEWLKT
jgi:hypothetical protein